MDKNNSQKAAGPQEQEGGISTKQRGVSQLEEGSENGHGKRSMRMSDSELIKVVKMSQSKDER